MRRSRYSVINVGVLLQPTDIPTVGRFAMIMDSQGATLSLITYAKQN